MSTLKLFELAPSPNNVKVRVTLGYKGIDYESHPVDPMNRQAAIDAYGVPLTPGVVMGDFRLYDSGAIMRWLDCNFDGPRIYPSDADAMREVESWERWGRTGLLDAAGPAFAMAFGREPHDPAVTDLCREGVTEISRKLEDALDGREWLVGDSLSGADIVGASRAVMVCPPDTLRDQVAAAGVPFWPYFHEHVSVQEERPRTREWVGRVMAYDRWLQA